MKKKYIIPSVFVVHLEPSVLLAGSIETNLTGQSYGGDIDDDDDMPEAAARESFSFHSDIWE